jgi:hypothetical protein
VTTLPALEAALDAAAHRHYGRRPRRGWRFALIPALAAGACAAALVFALPGRALDDPAEAPSGPTVPPETLALAAALARAPDVPKAGIHDAVIAHAQLPAVAEGYEARTPYPPGRRDRFDWLSTAPGPHDMASIGYARDVRMLVEWRAACIWLRFYLDTDGAPREAAGAVLATVKDWPTIRSRPGNWAGVPGELHYRRDCSPWRDRQG